MRAIDTLIFIVWVAFWTYWFISAFGVKKNARKIGHFVGIRIIAVILVVTVVAVTHTHTNQSMVQQTSPALVMLGFAVILTGLAFAVWARLHIGNNWATPMSPRVDTQLVTSGPYQFVRHPIYTGVIVAMLGNVIALGQYWIFALAIAGGYFVFSAHVEERHLAEVFPKEYPSYKKRTKMLIPFVY